MANILVIGGSLGGLLAANMLLRAGHQVRVLEKSSASLDGRGAGIVTHQPLMQALAQCGLAVDTSTSAGQTLGVQLSRRVALAQDGSVLSELHLPQLVTSWSRLYALLLSAFPAAQYVSGAAVSSVSQQGDGVVVRCADGRVFEADLAVASDGIRSSVRGLLAPEAQPLYAGYVAWRGVCDESALSAHTLDSIFDCFGFAMAPGEQLIGYPVAGAGNVLDKGQRRYNFVWYRPADAAALASLMTDSDGIHFPLGIAPGRVAPAHVAEARAAAQRLLAPQFAEIIAKTTQPFLQPIYDCTTPAMAFGRVALMGDAAFVARPHVGMGVTKAAEDAMALVHSIAQHGATPAALTAFEQQRLAPCHAVVQRGRVLGAHLQAPLAGAAKQRAAAPTPAPAAVVAHTAIDLSRPQSGQATGDPEFLKRNASRQLQATDAQAAGGFM